MVVTSSLCSNVIEHRYSSNKCFIIYIAACRRYFTGNQTKNASVAASTCFPFKVKRNLQCNMKLTCHATKIVALCDIN